MRRACSDWVITATVLSISLAAKLVVSAEEHGDTEDIAGVVLGPDPGRRWQHV